MNLKTSFSLLMLLLFSFSCPGRQEEVFDPAKETKPQTEDHSLINSQVNTIPTGVPIPANGKWINPDSVAKPKVVPLHGRPKVVPARDLPYLGLLCLPYRPVKRMRPIMISNI